MKDIPGLECILLVDDDNITNMIHQKVIQAYGLNARIVITNNGQEALDYLNGRGESTFIKPGIIFLDINMPLMDGWEFLKKYRELPEDRKATVLIVMHTDTNHRDNQTNTEHPYVDRFLLKTLSVESLENIIEAHFT